MKVTVLIMTNKDDQLENLRIFKSEKDAISAWQELEDDTDCEYNFWYTEDGKVE